MKHKVDCFLPFDPTPSSRKWPRVWACYIPQWLLMVAKQPQTPRGEEQNGTGPEAIPDEIRPHCTWRYFC